MRGPPTELQCELLKFDVVPSLECSFADLVLLAVVMNTKADSPLVGRFDACPGVGAASNMRALNR